MTGALAIPKKESLAVAGQKQRIVPALVAAEGERATRRYVEFFSPPTSAIRTPATPMLGPHRDFLLGVNSAA